MTLFLKRKLWLWYVPVYDSYIDLLVWNSKEGSTLHLFNVVAIVAEQSSHAGFADLAQLFTCESSLVISMFIEVTITDTSSVELFSENTQEGGASQGTGNMGFEGSANGQVNVFVADIQGSQVVNILEVVKSL